MGCALSSGGSDESKYELRVLVLGTASCGKSTFSRQLKLLFCNGFTQEESFNYRNILVQNLMLGLRELVLQIEDEFPKKLKKQAKFFRNINAYTQQLDANVVRQAKDLWESKIILNAFHNANRKFEFAESLSYIMEHLDRISGEGWTPTSTDILHVRQRTTGIVETRFKHDDKQMKKFTWVMIDVGGQRVERRKWVHSQQNLTAVIYFVALDEYDVIGEDENKSGMQESLDVWEETVTGFQSKLPVILFLNKKDLFEEKIKKVPIKNTWKGYAGGKDFEHAVEFIKGLYLERVHDGVIAPNDIYCHPTCAIDTENIRFVFSAIKEFIFKARLVNSGL